MATKKRAAEIVATGVAVAAVTLPIAANPVEIGIRASQAAQHLPEFLRVAAVGAAGLIAVGGLLFALRSLIRTENGAGNKQSSG